MSRAIKPPSRSDKLLSNWEPGPERAPSIMREDKPLFARVVAMIGLFFLVLGTLAMLAPTWQRQAILPPALGFFLASLGVTMILFHAFMDREFQFRRLYAVVGLALVAAGVIFRLLAFRGERAMAWPVQMSGTEVTFFYSLPAFFLGLIVLIAVIRNETDAYFRTLLINVVGGLGALMILAAMFLGMRDTNHQYLPGEGAAFLLLGLLYAGTYIGMQEANSQKGYRATLALGAIGILGFVVGLARSFMAEGAFFLPSGVILMGISLIYIAIAAGVVVDWPTIVMTRRELANYFLSPVGYLVFIGQLACALIAFFFFTRETSGGVLEPIIGQYIFNLFPVIVQTILVPALTMRLLSDERKSGTLEVLLTAPVSELSVVLGKFFACWIFYMLLWLPWWIFLISLRYMGGEEFDYRPILSFNIALAATNAGFMALGLFFSSLTQNQIIAAVLTFVAMLGHLAFFFLSRQILSPGDALGAVLGYINYFDFWYEALNGILAPRFVIFHVSVAIFFLFATVKVLEARKWK